MDRSSGFWWGAILIVLGALFLLENLDVVSIGDIIRDYWPTLLILWGLLLLTRDFPVRRTRPVRETARHEAPPGPGVGGNRLFGDISERTTAETMAYSTVFGDLHVNVESPAFRGGTVSTVFGDSTFDLSRACLSEGEHVVRFSSIFGDITVVLPPETTHALAAHTMFGSIDAGGQHRDGISSSLMYQMPGYESAIRRVRLEVSAIFGDIKVEG